MFSEPCIILTTPEKNRKGPSNKKNSRNGCSKIYRRRRRRRSLQTSCWTSCCDVPAVPVECWSLTHSPTYSPSVHPPPVTTVSTAHSEALVLAHAWTMHGGRFINRINGKNTATAIKWTFSRGTGVSRFSLGSPSSTCSRTEHLGISGTKFSYRPDVLPATQP